jgi:hypothetical protein
VKQPRVSSGVGDQKAETNGLGSGGWSGSKLICFWGRVKGYPCQDLLDCGSTENCMSSKFDARAGVALQEVTMAGGCNTPADRANTGGGDSKAGDGLCRTNPIQGH